MFRQIAFFSLVVCAFIIAVSKTSHAALGDIIKSFPSPNWGPRDLAWDGTYLWHSDSGSNLIYKLNPANGAVLASFPTQAVNPWGIGFVGNRLWNFDGFAKGYYSVDPNVGPPWTLEFSKPTIDHVDIAYDGTYIWSTNISLGIIDKMDLSGNIVSSIPAPNIGPAGIVWDGSTLWVSDAFTDTVYQINPSNGAVIQSFSAPSTDPYGLTFDGTNLWLSDYLSATIYQIDAGFTSTPAPPGTTTLLVMLGGLGGYAALQRLRLRRKSA